MNQGTVADVLIIGSGAGGGPLACTLAEEGFRIVVLEKGPRHSPRDDYVHDELAVALRGFFVPSVEEEPHILVRPEDPQPRPTNLGWIATCLGGGTVHMGGFLYRFHPDDFRMRSRFGAHEALCDWPYTYAELEPYYSRAEWAVGVSGDAERNPFAGPRSRPYPMPPLSSHPVTDLLDQACTRRGLHPFPTPRAVNSRPFGGRPACSYCQWCAGYGCPTDARGSTQVTLLRQAEATGRCEIRSRAMVRKITVDSRGRATGCLYLDEQGREHRVAARVVCVCCSAIESARLLLLSASPQFPDGLANGNGLVGRYLQFHAASSGHAHFRKELHRDKPLADRHPTLERSLMDYYFLPDGVSAIAKGGLIRFGLPQLTPVLTALGLAAEGTRILWGSELKHRLRDLYRENRTLGFEVFHDFLPDDRTRMELDPEVRDRWGLPVARIHLDPSGHHKTAGRWLVDRGLEVLDDLGADRLERRLEGDIASFLVQGTCRAGRDPRTSVLNSYCQTHEVPNLWVVDGSFMPTSGGAAPTLTILANAFRTADHIAERARRGEIP